MKYCFIFPDMTKSAVNCYQLIKKKNKQKTLCKPKQSATVNIFLYENWDRSL